MLPAKLQRLVTAVTSYSCSNSEFTSQLRLEAATGQLLGETKSEETRFTHPEVLFGLKVINGRLHQNAAGKVYVMKARESRGE